jgi:hypothetical protein
MRKMSKLLAFFMAITSVLVIQSCDDDDPKPAAPSVTAPTTVATVQIGTKADVVFTFATPGKFKSSAVTATGGEAAVKTDGASSSLEGSVVVEFTAGTTPGAASVTLTVTDNENQTTSQTATLNISVSAPPTLSLSTTTVSGVPGGTAEVTVTVNAPNGASSLDVSGMATSPASPITLSGTAPTQAVTLSIPANAVIGSSINVFFTVKDAQNLTSSAVLLTVSVSNPTIALEGSITSNMTLDATKRYLIKGKVYVQAPATLTIPAGTILFGEKDSDGTLIINRGAKLDAQGTATNPIIMTSQAPKGFRNRGDWGGVVLLGKAYNSNGVSAPIEGITATSNSENGVYGPGNGNAADDDNSGILQYVRIEYAGIALSPDNELNSLTMGSVGSGTTIDHIMVSYANDDAFEWFGGSVNHKYLIAYSTNDDDFDTDRGYNGKVQFGLVVRDNSVADFSGSKAWESSSLGGTPQPFGGAPGRHSAPVFSNVTVLGPRLFGTSIDTDYKSAFEVNSNSTIKVHNSIIAGFPTTASFATVGSTVTGNVFTAATNAANSGLDASATTNPNPPATFGTDNTYEATASNIFGPFTHKSSSSLANNNIYSLTDLPNVVLQAVTSPYLTGAMDLSADPFFENVAYKGAFGSSAAAGWNYSSGWVNFDPNNANY